MTAAAPTGGPEPAPTGGAEPAPTVPGWLLERSRHGGIDEIPLPGTGGRLWLCGKHLVGPDPERVLAALGADRIVCLCEEHELIDRFPDYVAWLDAERDGSAIWFPVPDLHAPDAARTARLLGSIRAALDRGETLVLHCGAGIGRAGTIAAALLIDLGVAHDDAVDTVGRHRPLAGPEAGAQAELLRALSAAGNGVGSDGAGVRPDGAEFDGTKPDGAAKPVSGEGRRWPRAGGDGPVPRGPTGPHEPDPWAWLRS